MTLFLPPLSNDVLLDLEIEVCETEKYRFVSELTKKIKKRIIKEEANRAHTRFYCNERRVTNIGRGKRMHVHRERRLTVIIAGTRDLIKIPLLRVLVRNTCSTLCKQWLWFICAKKT